MDLFLLSTFDQNPYLLLWTLFPNFFFFLILPAISFSFFCRYISIPCPWWAGILYLFLSALLYLLEISLGISSFFCLLAEILLLALWGCLLGKGNREKFLSSLAAATLVASVVSICHGISQLLFFWLFTKAIHALPSFIPAGDGARELVKLLLTAFLLTKIHACLPPGLSLENRLAALLLTIPVFYITLVERTIQNTIYGNTIIWEDPQGIVSPIVNHTEVLLLQAFACICLFLSLWAWQKIQKAKETWQTLQLLKQQAHEQETYLQEVRLRYEQTRSFRHDIQNHLTVLSELLDSNQAASARQYLSHLKQSSLSLSLSVQTGNAPVDALLGSKLSLAKQTGISVECQMKIPACPEISDIDWCILLANAIDNAVKATCALPPPKRRLLLSGKQKGNFYLLSIENSCPPSMAKPPREGIGLSNIRAVMNKYHGTVQIQAGDGTFRLNLLFVLPPFFHAG